MREHAIIVLLVVGFGLLFVGLRQMKNVQRNVSIGELIDSRINLRRLSDFLAEQDCQYLINLSQAGFARSTVVVNGQPVVDTGRTSSSYMVPSEDPVAKRIQSKCAQIVGVPVSYIEQLQVVRYRPGDMFSPHHDWYKPDYVQKENKQRLHTFFVYLNDIEDGGETRFPKLDKQFKPEEGTALYWVNCDNGSCYDESLHQGLPPVGNVKYGLNVWVNNRTL